MIKVLVVDDSALMRKHLSQILEAQGDMEVRTARNGKTALEEVELYQPDVITLDINMPEMDGLTALSRIMVDNPRPVVMVSSLTEKGALATFEAMELGAIDYVLKPGGTVSLNIHEIAELLVQKVRTAAKAKIRKGQGLAQRLQRERLALQQRQTPRTVSRNPAKAVGTEWGLVLIGSSTGGPRTLEEILSVLPQDFSWPILVAQHMPAQFTGTFARRLDTVCDLTVVELDKPTAIKPGYVYIGRGDADVLVAHRPAGLMAIPLPADAEFLWHPSVDRMVNSAMDHLPAERLIGVLLTGMGHDGAEAMRKLHACGGRTIAESEETAVVYGMPQELVSRKGASTVLPHYKVARQLKCWVH